MMAAVAATLPVPAARRKLRRESLRSGQFITSSLPKCCEWGVIAGQIYTSYPAKSITFRLLPSLRIILNQDSLALSRMVLNRSLGVRVFHLEGLALDVQKRARKSCDVPVEGRRRRLLNRVAKADRTRIDKLLEKQALLRERPCAFNQKAHHVADAGNMILYLRCCSASAEPQLLQLLAQ